LFWLSSGMYWDMMDMISESMYDCNTTAKSFQLIELPSAQTFFCILRRSLMNHVSFSDGLTLSLYL
jgi:hypothetical protein